MKMLKFIALAAAGIACLAVKTVHALPFANDEFAVSVPSFIIAGNPVEIELKALDLSHPDLIRKDNTIQVTINRSTTDVSLDPNGRAVIQHRFHTGDESLHLQIGQFSFEQEVHPMPLWFSILPPLLAIVMALLFKEVISSLFCGILLGAVFMGYYTQGGVAGIAGGFLAVIDTYLIKALSDEEHAAIIIFSLTIGGMVGVISRNGGMQGIVEKLSRYASTRKSGQMVTWLLGVAIFFDDYANSLVVGNTMRPITDKLRISREKLSYLVDSTAAPVSSIAFITTWIGAELSYIGDSLEHTGITESSYSIFFSSLSYSFYPILTLAFMLMLILKNRDFGPMLKAERRALRSGDVESERSKSISSAEMAQFEPMEGIRFGWHNAVVPILVLIGGAIIGLLYTGLNGTYDALAESGISVLSHQLFDVMRAMDSMDPAPSSFFQKIGLIIGNADSYAALLWASLASAASALLLTLSQRLMSLEHSIMAMTNGFKAMFHAILILVLAWALAAVTQDLHTADFVTQSLLSGGVAPSLLPAITFVMASVIAFSTGSSWGTMAILYPLMLPAAWSICLEHGMTPDQTMPIFYNVVSCVLAGSVLGDHCSPISDTTILSSLATTCNHIDHVRTQLPYALMVGFVALTAGTLLSGLGMPPLAAFGAGLAALYGVVHFVGRKV